MSPTTTTEIVVYGPNLTGPHDFHVHALGCADCQRGRRAAEYDRPMVMPAGSTLEDVVNMVYADFIEEGDTAAWLDYAGEFRVFPCATLGEEV